MDDFVITDTRERDSLGRYYAGYDCLYCPSKVWERWSYLEDECGGCGASYPTKKSHERLKYEFFHERPSR